MRERGAACCGRRRCRFRDRANIVSSRTDMNIVAFRALSVSGELRFEFYVLRAFVPATVDRLDAQPR